MSGNHEPLTAALFDAHFEPLLSYARRRTTQLSDAEDVVAETFVVMWRRIDRLPERPEEQLLWLYGIARRVIANQRRSTGRRVRLLERLRSSFAAPSPASAVDVRAAFAALPERDQEVLSLVAWEGLTHAESAIVLGISPNAVAIRVHRARVRLRRKMKGASPARTLPGWKGSVSKTEHRREAR